VPKGDWVDSQSDNGIDISSPTGSIHVGLGFGPTIGPVTHEWAVDVAVNRGGLDPHPLRKLKLGRGSKPKQRQGIVRRVYKWRAYRSDRGERIKGVLTVDTFSDPLTLTHGYSLASRGAPSKKYRRWKKKLALMQKQIRLQPRSPEWGWAFPGL
jgi:hypothetical protein